MSITYGKPSRYGHYTRVPVTSDLSGTVYYHWYQNGRYKGMSLVPYKMFYLPMNYQADIDCIDTNDPDFDGTGNSPGDWPDFVTLFWTRVDGAAYYIIEQNKDAGGWETIGREDQVPNQWSYVWETERLVDQSTYQFRITAYDAAGNPGTAKTLTAEKHSRRPDAPNVTTSFDEDTDKFTFTAV